MVLPAEPSPPSSSSSLRGPTLVDRALQELRSDLARGRFGPGDRVGVDQLAAEWGISPLPVREALRVLLTEGRVEYASHRGYRVTRLTLQDVEEIFLICRLLESEGLRRGVPALDDAAITRMGELLEAIDSAPVDEEASWKSVALHQEFHLLPIDCCGLPRLIAELRQLWDHTDHYRALYFFQDREAHAALQFEHRAIYDACRERDGERVAELMNEHREHAIEWMRRGFAADQGES